MDWAQLWQIATLPDNVPITLLIVVVPFYAWYGLRQSFKNDRLIDQLEADPELAKTHHRKTQPWKEGWDREVFVWPYLLRIEFLVTIIVTFILMVWSITLDAPLEAPANPSLTMNPSKAPWYFLGLQEMLVYFDPWMAGVVLPSLIIVGLMAIPYLDNNSEGSGYYSYKNRKLSISIYMFGWLVLWNLLIVIGVALRGPNWNFFGPFEYWDSHKVEALTNINLSEFIYVKWMSTGLPENILFREIWGLLLVLGYFLILPPLLAKTKLKGTFEQLGAARYSVFIVLILTALFLPIKMYLRWMFNLKYIIAIPEYFFNF